MATTPMDGGRQGRLHGIGAIDQDQIMGFLHKGGAGQLLNLWLR
jgi:hypothetical protein